MSDSSEPDKGKEKALLQAQYLRALSSFEGIVLAQLEVKNQLGHRLNWTIRAGLILLGVIAFSILVLLLTLSSQINRMSGVVVDINRHFDSITQRMDRVSLSMGAMEQRVALLENMRKNTELMDKKVATMSGNTGAMSGSLTQIQQQLSRVGSEIGHISHSVARMNDEVGIMALQMNRLSKPARSMNRLVPMP